MYNFIILEKPLPQSTKIQEVKNSEVIDIVPVGQHLSFVETDKGIRVTVEISNMELIKLLKDLENIDNITAEGLQLVYRVESKNDVIFKEVE